ncbi:MAG: hypothetical protein HC824_19120 [Synechococcales cyanobacterium RM1_1_8]|nr:hypothetical protein [Synechococcales cyanobacterium RM1_1_8]
MDREAYPDTTNNDAASYDVNLGAFSAAGANGAVATQALGGAGANVPAVASPGNGAAISPTLLTPIFTIQGAGHRSPLVGNSVTTSGIVTAVDSNGFYLQDPTGDGDIATSDALFVFTGSAPGVAVGDAVRVAGTVSEFTPGGAATGNLSTTQISGNPSLSVLSSGNALPTAVLLGNGDRVVPNQTIDDDAFAAFEPTSDGIDFFESLEGMRVTVPNALVIAPTNGFGEIFTVADGGANATGISDRGTLNISPTDFNPEKIQIDEDEGVFDFNLPQVDVGATLGDVTGVVSYSFGNFEVIPTQDFTATVVNSSLSPDVTTLQGSSTQLTVATYNVLNLETNDGDGDADVANGRFAAIAQQIVTNLKAPDIIGLQEIQDNSGSVNDGVTSAAATLQALVDAIAAAGGPTYSFIDNSFITDGASGGQPGGNIRTAFLYNDDRVDLQPSSVQTIGGQAAGEAFAGGRLPLWPHLSSTAKPSPWSTTTSPPRAAALRSSVWSKTSLLAKKTPASTAAWMNAKLNPQRFKALSAAWGPRPR